MISFRQKGDFSKVTSYFEKLKETMRLGILDKYGREGVNALSWYYEIEHSNGSAAIQFYNSHVNKGVPIAIILQYGHGTGTGGWVQGRDYINPAIQPLFDKMAEEVWKEVTSI